MLPGPYATGSASASIGYCDQHPFPNTGRASGTLLLRPACFSVTFVSRWCSATPTAGLPLSLTSWLIALLAHFLAVYAITQCAA